MTFTLGNIDLRDFELEENFADMSRTCVEGYDKKWWDALDNNDTDYLSNHCYFGLSFTFWSK